MSQAGGQGRPRADLPQRPFYYQCPACGYPANHLPPTEENRVILLTEPQANSSWYYCCRVCPFPVTNCTGQRVHMPLPEGFIPALKWETRTVPDWGPFADPSAPSGGGGQDWNQEDLYEFEVDEHGWHPSQYHEPAYRNFVVNQWLEANNPRPPLPYPENRYYWPPNPTDYSSSQGGANSSQYHDCLNANSNSNDFRGGTSTPPPSIPGAPPIQWDSDPSDDEYFTADEQFPEQDQEPLDREAALYVQQTRENFVRLLAQQERQQMEQQPQQQPQVSRYLDWGQLGTAAHAPRQGFQNPGQRPAGQGPLAQRRADADGSGQDSHEQHRE